MASVPSRPHQVAKCSEAISWSIWLNASLVSSFASHSCASSYSWHFSMESNNGVRAVATPPLAWNAYEFVWHGWRSLA